MQRLEGGFFLGIRNGGVGWWEKGPEEEGDINKQIVDAWWLHPSTPALLTLAQI